MNPSLMATQVSRSQRTSLPCRPVDVLHVVPGYFPDQGGIQTLVHCLSAQVRERFGLTSAVVSQSSTPGLAPPCPSDEMAVYRIGSWIVNALHGPEQLNNPVSKLEAFGALSKLFGETREVFAATQPRILHIHHNSLPALPAAAIAGSKGVPVVLHVHGLLAKGELRWFHRLRAQGAHIVAVSTAVQRSIMANSLRDSEPLLIRNAIPDPMVGVRPWRPTSPSVGMVSRFTAEKGLAHGMQALDLVRQRIPGLRIRLAGAGPGEADLWNVCRDLNLVHAIDYLGPIDNQRALDVTAGVDVVVVPSVETEGFSLTALEAALLGKPVVGTSVGGLAETVTNGETGLIVPPRDIHAMADAIETLLTEASLYRRMSIASRRRALERFPMDKFTEDMGSLYGSMITTSPPA